MVKKFNLKCNFGGQTAITQFFIGNPRINQHPIAFQSKWISNERGGQVSPEIMDSMAKIQKLAEDTDTSFEELFFYAVNLANNMPIKNNENFNKLLISL